MIPVNLKFLLMISLTTLLLLSTSANSQLITGKASPVLLKGKVIDEITGQPTGVSIEIRNNGGQKIKINSNSLSGIYEQLLESGHTYEFIFSGYDVIRKTETVKLIDTNKYAEQEINFTIKKLTPGGIFQNVDAFDKSSLSPNENLKNVFDEIRDIMKFNRAVSFEFSVNAHDTYIKAPDPLPVVVDKKAKKKKQPKTVVAEPAKQADPDPEQVKKLVDSRFDAINQILNDESWKRYSKRISFIKDYSLGEASQKKGTDMHPHDFRVVVSSLDTNLTK